jgi:hypothetical protein
MQYGYPDVGRFGLGHSLLAWARCVVWCDQVGAKMLAPRWFRLRIGPYLRGERDKREYFKLFNQDGYVGTLGRTLLLLTSPKVSAEAPSAPVEVESGNVITVFTNSAADNTEKYFSAIRGHGKLLHDNLLRITKPRYRPNPAAAPFVAVHVRMGDFTRLAQDGNPADQKNSRLPIEWYVSVVKRLNASTGGNLPIVVFSDGSDEEIALLLALDSVRRAPKQESVTDMLQIAQASLLVSSASGFSMWGAFLGQVPRICFPGTKVTAIMDNAQDEIELDFDAAIPAHFVAVARSIADRAR